MTLLKSGPASKFERRGSLRILGIAERAYIAPMLTPHVSAEAMLDALFRGIVQEGLELTPELAEEVNTNYWNLDEQARQHVREGLFNGDVDLRAVWPAEDHRIVIGRLEQMFRRTYPIAYFIRRVRGES